MEDAEKQFPKDIEAGRRELTLEILQWIASNSAYLPVDKMPKEA